MTLADDLAAATPVAPLSASPQPVPVELEGGAFVDPWVDRARVVGLIVLSVVGVLALAVLVALGVTLGAMLVAPFVLVATAALAYR
jgi:hypothetical protein